MMEKLDGGSTTLRFLPWLYPDLAPSATFWEPESLGINIFALLLHPTYWLAFWDGAGLRASRSGLGVFYFPRPAASFVVAFGSGTISISTHFCSPGARCNASPSTGSLYIHGL